MKNLIRVILVGMALGSLSSSHAYIGGKLVTSPEFLSVVTIDPIRCTAAKVGPRHFLLAAHCLTPRGSVPTYQAGDSLEVFYGLDRRVMKSHRTRVKAAFVHPSYAKLIARRENADSVVGKRGIIDLALLVVEDLTRGVPIEAIQWDPLKVGDPVVVGGYGALNSVGSFSWVYTAAHKKVWKLSPTFATVTDVDADGRTHSMGWSGDSGGPVHVWRPGTRPRIVGVNSFVTGEIWVDRFGRLEDPKYSGTTNFVRFDHPEVRSWLTPLLSQ